MADWSAQLDVPLDFRRGQNGETQLIGIQHIVYKKWCDTVLEQQAMLGGKGNVNDGYLIIYCHSFGKASYFILKFTPTTSKLGTVSTGLDIKQLFSHDNYQNGIFYKYTENYEQLVKLTHTKSLKEQGVESGNVIRFIRKFEIYVESQAGINHAVVINQDLTDTIRSIKEKLKSNYQIIIDDKKQRLVTAATLMALNDTKNGKLASLKDYGVDIEDKLKVETITEMILYIETLTGKKISIDNVRANFTIGTVKDLVNNKEGIPSKEQILMFKGALLNDKKTLEACGIENQNIVVLQQHIRDDPFAKEPKKIAQFSNDNNNNQDNKKNINNQNNNSIDVVVSHNVLNVETGSSDYRMNELVNTRLSTMVNIKLASDQSVHSAPKYLIYVPNKQAYLSVQEIQIGDDTVTGHSDSDYSGVECVARKIYANSNKSVEMFALWLKNVPNVLVNGKHVENGSPMDLVIQLQGGDKYKINIDIDTDTIQDIKLEIEKLLNIDQQSQQLQFKNQALQDSKMAQFYDITGGDTLKLTIEEANKQEMGLAVGGRMQQKLYIDKESNFNMYDYKNPTRIFINMANGPLWKAIRDKPMATLPLASISLTKDNFAWFYMCDESIKDLPASNVLGQVKCIDDIENRKPQSSKTKNVASLSHVIINSSKTSPDELNRCVNSFVCARILTSRYFVFVFVLQQST